MKSEAEKIRTLFSEASAEAILVNDMNDIPEEKPMYYTMTPIGYISSCFKFKNGIPRQPSLCPTAKGTLKIQKSLFTNPEHSLIGLNEFSHVWILFVFHENGHTAVKAKVHPPRLNGASVGVFSTRSPHRPSAIGLSLTKLDKIEDDTLFLSGIDLLDGTPVLDIKPYIPMYDNPALFKDIPPDDHEETENDSNLSTTQSIDCDNSILLGDESNSQVMPAENKTLGNSQECKVPLFLKEPPQKLDVVFTNRALNDLEHLHITPENEFQSDECLHVEYRPSEVKQAIIEVLQNDPRSIYRKEKCSDKLYYFYINQLHVTCWFDDTVAEVLRIKSSKTIPK